MHAKDRQFRSFRFFSKPPHSRSAPGLIHADELSGLLGTHTENTSREWGSLIGTRYEKLMDKQKLKVQLKITLLYAQMVQHTCDRRVEFFLISCLNQEMEKETIAGNMRGFAYIMRSGGAHKTMHINLSGKDFSCRRDFR